MRSSKKPTHGRPDALTAAGFAALMLAAHGAAHAQDADATKAQTDDDATVSTVVVTGIRHGIEDAITLKRDSTSIVEAV